MFTTRSLLLVSLIALALGKPMGSNMKLHESREGIPDGFSLRGPALPGRTLKLRIALVQSNVAELERKLMDVSTPSSANYGKHLSKVEVEQLVAPTHDSVDAVNAWLKESDINARPISPTGDWLSFEVPVRKANELFDADFSVYTHDETGKEAVRTLSYSIPAELQGHLDLVHPAITFPNFKGLRPIFSSQMKTAPQTLTCDVAITPACLQTLYHIPSSKASQPSNRLAVTGYIQQYANEDDLESFLDEFRPDTNSSTTFTTSTIDGGSNPQDPGEAGLEANLDIQYTVGVATGVPVEFVSVGDDVQDGGLEGFLDTVHYVLSESTVPNVMTTSYGQNENTMSRNLANNLCNAYMQLGARGTSVLFASGDGGVAGSQSASCRNFVPTFPSGCPYMTSVGATESIVSETAADFSSGGFSNYFAAPSYQTTAISAYLEKLGNTNSGKFNRTGRGFPDISTQGVRFAIFVGGQLGTVDGTSCSSPTLASIISLLNDRLIAAGKSPLGFLNPFLYSTGASALNDITSGSNPGCNTNGFPAKAGWDPVTGLGTPDFNKLLKAVGL